MTFKPPGDNNVVLKKGVVVTNRAWNQPDNHSFQQWVKLVKDFIEDRRLEIDMYVCGKFLENPALTWDIDIILSHKNITYSKLPDIRDTMIYGMKLGFDKFNILIDISCYLPIDEHGKFWYSATDFLNHGTIQSTSLYCHDRIYQNGELIEYFENAEEVIPNLFMVTRETPGKKHIDRIRSGVVYKEPVKVTI